MKPVEIYTSPFCGYCHAAKRLLTHSPNSGNVAFEGAGTLQDAIEMLSAPLVGKVKASPESEA